MILSTQKASSFVDPVLNKIPLLTLFSLLILPLISCNTNTISDSTSDIQTQVQPFITGAIPDQDPEKLQRLYSKLADYLHQELGIPLEYKPVTDYTAAVTAFRVGDLDMVWFGGLTGVQARLQVPEAQAIAQRDIDAEFHTVFITHTNTGIKPFNDIEGLRQLKGKSITFGSESSTSGRLMPQYFLEQAGVTLEDFKGEPGFSGSHDTTIALVEAGTYEVGALNKQVWQSRVAENKFNLDKVQIIWQTPAYYDYHWLINPQVKERYGEDFINKVKAALLKLDQNNPQHKEILDLFGANKFIETQNENYRQIEEIGRKIGKIK